MIAVKRWCFKGTVRSLSSRRVPSGFTEACTSVPVHCRYPYPDQSSVALHVQGISETVISVLEKQRLSTCHVAALGTVISAFSTVPNRSVLGRSPRLLGQAGWLLAIGGVTDIPQ